ncbi:hypothetical protein B296_00008356 [Ensete ventricosum]|uniref:Uncharacterized protein n=1 Tax=Ensete ventricosum TaxID=4639 RepID=A0A427ANF9_ENSVE|nr:hypothetical protein B296_00008356 [Ensete ventricosum]
MVAISVYGYCTFTSPRISSFKPSIKRELVRESGGQKQFPFTVLITFATEGIRSKVFSTSGGAPTEKKSHKERLTKAETRLDVLEVSLEERKSTKANEGYLW